MALGTVPVLAVAQILVLAPAGVAGPVVVPQDTNVPGWSVLIGVGIEVTDSLDSEAV